MAARLIWLLVLAAALSPIQPDSAAAETDAQLATGPSEKESGNVVVATGDAAAAVAATAGLPDSVRDSVRDSVNVDAVSTSVDAVQAADQAVNTASLENIAGAIATGDADAAPVPISGKHSHASLPSSCTVFLLFKPTL